MKIPPIILALLVATPAVASPQDGTTRLIVFRNYAKTHPEVVYTKVENLKGCKWFPFEKDNGVVNGDEAQDHYTWGAQGLIYDPPKPAEPSPEEVATREIQVELSEMAANPDVDDLLYARLVRISNIKDPAVRLDRWEAFKQQLRGGQ